VEYHAMTTTPVETPAKTPTKIPRETKPFNPQKPEYLPEPKN